MKYVVIGKGMYRITVRSKAKRDRLSSIPHVLVDGKRIIFPEWLLGNIKMILNPQAKKKHSKTIQGELF